MRNFFNILLPFIFAVIFTSCGESKVVVESYLDENDLSLKSANTIEQAVLENIGSCTFLKQPDPSYAPSLEFKVSFFNEIKPSSFTSSNINNIGTGAATSINWNIVNCGDNKNFKLQATGIVGDGSIIPNISVAGIKYKDGSPSLEFSSSDNSVTYNTALAFTWLGAADSNWSNAANWVGGIKPGISDIAIFNSACIIHTCTANIDENVTVKGISIGIDFSGSISQAAGQSMTVGTSGFNQSGGFYLIGANNFSVEGDFKVNSGVFNSAGSLVSFSGSSLGVIPEIEASGVNLNNVEFTFGASGSVKTLNIVGTLKVLGNLVMNTDSNASGDRIDGGEIDVEGNLTVLNWDSHQSTVSIKMSGANPQTITAASGESLSSLVIDKSGGTLGFAGDPVEIKRDFNYVSGVVNIGTTKFIFNHETSGNITPGLFNFYDVEFSHGRSIAAVTKNIIGTMVVINDLTLDTEASANSDTINGGVIDLKGNINIVHSDIGTSTTEIILSGTIDQTITQVDGDLPGNITINKPSGKVVLASNYIQLKTNQSVTIESGSIDMAGFNLTIGNNLTLETLPTQTYLYTNCGSLIVGGATTDLGSGIIPSGSAPNVSISDASIIEGGNLEFTVSLSVAICVGNFTVNFNTNDESATLADSDYIDNDNVLTILPGITTATITVVTTVDTAMEADESLYVVLDTPSHGTLTDDTGYGLILNDDDNGYLWDGGGADDNWSTALNWTGDVAPIADGSTLVGFSDDCTNCNVIVDGDVDVSGFVMFTDYTGTITLQAGNTFITGTDGLILDAGTLIASDQNLDVKQMRMRGTGILTLASADIRIEDDFEYLGGVINWNGQAFITDSGDGQSIKPGTLAFNNVELRNSNSNNIDLNGQTWNINGDLTLHETGTGTTDLGNGFIDLSGDIYGNDHRGDRSLNTVVINMVSGGTQTINGAGSANLPNIDIQNATTVNLVGTIGITGNLIVTSGTINPGTSTVQFVYGNSQLTTVDIGTNSLNNMRVSKNACCSSNDISIVGNLDINGNLDIDSNHFNHDFLNGTITLAGDLSATNTGAGGTTVITLDGSGTQTITGVTTAVVPDLIINSTGTINLVGDIGIEGDLTYISGTVVPGTSKVSFVGNIVSNINSGAMSFNDVTFFKNSGSSSNDIIITGNMDINGDLRIELFTGQTIDNGTISLGGDLNPINATGGSAVITLDGSGTQNINGNLNAGLPNIEINSTGSVNLIGNVEIEGDFTYTAGTVLAGTSKVLFLGDIASNINSGTMTFNDVTFVKNSLSSSYNIVITGNMDINGDLTVNMGTNQTVNGGSINLAGDFIGTYVQNGSATITFDGTLDQNITMTAGNMMDGLITVNKASGKVFQTTNIDLNDGAQDLHLVAGSWDMGGFDLTIADDLTLETAPAQTYLYTNCGTLTVSGTTTDVGTGVTSSASNPNVTIADASVTEGGNLDFTVTLSEAVCGGNFTVNHTANDGTATIANTDYTDNDAILTILPGNLTGVISVVSTADANFEFDEKLTIELDTPSHGTLIDSNATGIILNDDAGGIVWHGDTGDNDFENTANWTGGAVPSVGDIVVLDDTCNDVPANCDINTSANISVLGVYIQSSYPGTITQNSTHTIDIGSWGWIQDGGTFTGGDSNITFGTSGYFELNAGIFTATSATTTVDSNLPPRIASFNGGTFNHNNGVFKIKKVPGVQGCSTYYDFNLSGSLQFYDVDIVGNGSCGSGHTILNLPGDKDVTVDNNLHVNGGYFEGNWHLSGDLTVLEGDAEENIGIKGVILFEGLTDQEYDFSAMSSPYVLKSKLVINKISGDVKPSIGTNDIRISTLSVLDGTFIAPNGELFFHSRVASSGGSITAFEVAPGAVYQHNNGVVKFDGKGWGCGGSTYFIDINPTTTLYDVKINAYSGCGAGSMKMEVLAPQILVVENDLSFETGAASGKWEVRGNILIWDNFLNGAFSDAKLFITGTADQTFTQLGTELFSGDIEVNKISGKVIQGSAVNLGNANQNLTFTDGEWDMAGFDLNVTDTFTLDSGTTLYTSCGNLTQGTLVNNGTIISSASNPNISIADASVNEGGNLDFIVTLSEAVCGGNFTANFKTNDLLAATITSDYTDNDNTLTITPGITTGTITVVTTADANYEFDEDLSVVLTSNSHGTITDGQAIGMILNDDAGGVIWSGLAAADDTWSNGLNWVGGVAPTGTEVAVFDGTCTNCDADIDGNLSLGGILFEPAYTGTVTQLAGNTITLDTNGISMAGGTFVGGDSDITILYPAATSITGGSFTSTTATYGHNFSLFMKDGVFTHNSGDLKVMASGSSARDMFFNSGNNQFNNVEINRGWSDNIYILNDVYIDGDFYQNNFHSQSCTFAGPYNVHIKGDYNSGRHGDGTYNYDTVFVLDGTTDQTITQTHTGGYINNLTINKSSGTTFLVGDVVIRRNFIVTSGIVDVGTSSMKWGIMNSSTVDVFYSGITYNDFEFARGWATQASFSDGTLEVDGDLYVGNHYETVGCTGTIEARGDVAIGDDGGRYNGGNNCKLILNGITDQNLSTTHTEGWTDMVTIDKPSGAVNLTSNFLTRRTNADFYIKQGSVNMAGFDLDVAGTLTLDPGTFLYTNCGAHVEGTLANSGTIVGSGSNPNITISDESEMEGINQIFTVALSEAVCGSATTIDYLTTTGSAVEGTDFTDTNGTLNIPAKSITGTITVPTTVDADYEPAETFIVEISNTSNGSITDTDGLGTILNDDLSNFTWTGLNGDGKWSTNGNWSGGTAPGGSDIAVFDGTCTNCNANIDVAATANTIVLDYGYTGVVTQQTGNTITLGSGGLYQAAGTFVGGDSLIDINKGNFKLAGGVFSSTSGIFNIDNPDSGNRTAIDISATATFNHSNGHVKTSGRFTPGTANAYINLGKDINFYNLDITSNHGSFNLTRMYLWNVVGGFNAIVENDFGILGTNDVNGYLSLSSGVVEVRGDLYFDQGAYGTGKGGEIILNGTGNQEFHEVTANGYLPRLVIDKTSGTVDAGGGTTILKVASFSLIDGTFNAPPNMEIHNRQNNIIDELLFKTTSGSVFNGATTSLKFAMYDNASVGTGDLDLDGPIIVNNLYFSTLYNSTIRGSHYTFVNANQFIVNNDLTINSDIGPNGRIKLYGSSIEVKGNTELGVGANGGTTSLLFSGAGNQTIDGTNLSTNLTGNFEVNKPSGKVIQLSDLTLSGGSQDLHLIAGDWDMAGHDLTVQNDLTLETAPAQTYLYKNCATLLVNGTTTDVGSGITTSTSTPNISISDPSVSEGGNLDYVVTLSEAVCGSAVTVDFASSNGSAMTVDNDYTATSGTLSLPIGQTSGIISLVTTTDTYAEEDETVFMTLSNSSTGVISDGVGVGTILNDDGPAPVNIYRSTGFGRTSALSMGLENSGTDLTISGSVATFEHPQSDNIGIGDLIQYDSSGDSLVDSIIFINGRISSTQYNVQTVIGAAVSDLGSADTDWGIFRAYTSLANAENGIENTGIDDTLENFDTWSGGKDLVASNEVWNIVAYADAVDSTVVSISGWTTEKNTSINIVTPTDESQVGRSQRHNGIWSEGGFILDPGVSGSNTISIDEHYVSLDGLQVRTSNVTGARAISVAYGSGKLIRVGNSIIRGPQTGAGNTKGILFDITEASSEIWFINNIVYGFDGATGYGVHFHGATPALVFNNTLSNNVNSITVQTGSTKAVFKNNLVMNSITTSFAGGAGFHATSDYNISGDGNMPGPNSITTSSVLRRNLSGNEFRLDSSDTMAKNAGLDLTSEGVLLVDFMGHPRGTDGSWDIGAHEAATSLYRSIGNGNTTSLQVGTGNDLSISSGVVTFASGIADNIGIGDIIQYDRSGDGTVDSFMFIHFRSNSTSFTVREQDGSIPADLATDDDWDIFRAYSSIANASNLVENSGIFAVISDFNDKTNLRNENFEMNYTLYADSMFTKAGVIFDSVWAKTPTANINLYVPSKASEVGTTQRHAGLWNTSYVHFIDSTTLVTPTDYMSIDGVQLFLDNDTASGFQYGVRSGTNFTLLNSIIRGPDANTSTEFIAGVYNGDLNNLGTVQNLINNVFYNWNNSGTGTGGIKPYSANIEIVASNNTFVDNVTPVASAHDYVLLTNNISQDLTSGFVGTYHPDSGNNLSSDINAPGPGSVTNSTLTFVNKAGDNFNLGAGDTDAQSSGVDLSNDIYYSYDSDILLQSRPSGDWDIGAFQF